MVRRGPPKTEIAGSSPVSLDVLSFFLLIMFYILNGSIERLYSMPGDCPGESIGEPLQRNSCRRAGHTMHEPPRLAYIKTPPRRALGCIVPNPGARTSIYIAHHSA